MFVALSKKVLMNRITLGPSHAQACCGEALVPPGGCRSQEGQAAPIFLKTAPPRRTKRNHFSSIYYSAFKYFYKVLRQLKSQGLKTMQTEVENQG